MIIESAFLKLPELLTSIYDHRDTYEATIAHLFSVAVLMELYARNIPSPYQQVFTEKAYPTPDTRGQTIHADVHINLSGVIETRGRMALYGAREVNWLEIKAFLTSTRSSSSAPRTANAGKILRDLLRLSILPEEMQGAIRQNGRFFLLVCSDPASHYLALQERAWLSLMLSEGYSEPVINLADEPESLRKEVGAGFIQSPDLRIHLRVRTRLFEPEDRTPSPVFWGYLVRILHYRIESGGNAAEFDDRPNDVWDANRIENLKKIRQGIITRF